MIRKFRFDSAIELLRMLARNRVKLVELHTDGIVIKLILITDLVLIPVKESRGAVETDSLSFLKYGILR